MLPSLFSSLRGMIKEYDGLDFFSSLYVEPVSQLARLYDSVFKDLRIIKEEIANLSNKHISLPQRMESAALYFEHIRMSLNLLKNRSICISQGVDARLEWPSCLAMDREMDVPTDDHGPSMSNTNLRRSSTIWHIAHYEPLHFPNALFRAISLPPIGGWGVSSIPPPVPDSFALFQDASATPYGCLVPYYPVVQVHETTHTLFKRFVDYRF